MAFPLTFLIIRIPLYFKNNPKRILKLIIKIFFHISLTINYWPIKYSGHAPYIVQY